MEMQTKMKIAEEVYKFSSNYNDEELKFVIEELKLWKEERERQDKEMWEEEHTRVCTECGERFTEGYCIENGLEYYCGDECLHKHYSDDEYNELYDDGNGDSYYTTWA